MHVPYTRSHAKIYIYSVLWADTCDKQCGGACKLLFHSSPSLHSFETLHQPGGHRNLRCPSLTYMYMCIYIYIYMCVCVWL